MEVFNELCIMATAYHLFMFTDYEPDANEQYKVGYSMIALTTFNIAINMGVIIIQGVSALVKRRKRIF